MTPTLEARLAEVLPCYECHPVEHRTGCPAVHRPAILALIRTLLREERERCAVTALEQKGEAGVPWTLAADACTLALAERNTFMAERDQARRFAEEAAQKYNELLAEKRVLRCAFCNFEYQEGTPPTQHEALTQHIRECQSHPYRMEVAGLRWEIGHCRELLRHIVAVAYKGTLSNEMELALSSVNNYLAGVPQTEVES